MLVSDNWENGGLNKISDEQQEENIRERKVLFQVREGH